MVDIEEIIEDESNTTSSQINLDKIDETIKQMPVNNGGICKNYVWTQTAYELSILIPIHDNNLRSKDLDIKMLPNLLTIFNKLNNQILIEGEFYLPIKVEKSIWYIDSQDSQRILILDLQKLKPQEWWPTPIKGHPEIDTAKVTPANENISDLDDETRATVAKMLYDQKIKEEQRKQHIIY